MLHPILSPENLPINQNLIYKIHSHFRNNKLKLHYGFIDLCHQAFQTLHFILPGIQLPTRSAAEKQTVRKLCRRNPLHCLLHLNHSQLEESCPQLQKQHMRKPVFMNDENALHCPAHSHFVKLFSHPLEPGGHRPILLIQRFFGTKRVVRERVSGKKEKKKTVLNSVSNLKALLYTSIIDVYKCFIKSGYRLMYQMCQVF